MLGYMCVWDKTMEHNSNKIFDTIDVRKSLQIITDIAVTGPEMSYLSVCLWLWNAAGLSQTIKEKIKLI